MKKINKLLTILLVGSSIYTVPVYANEPKKLIYPRMQIRLIPFQL